MNRALLDRNSPSRDGQFAPYADWIRTFATEIDGWNHGEEAPVRPASIHSILDFGPVPPKQLALQSQKIAASHVMPITAGTKNANPKIAPNMAPAVSPLMARYLSKSKPVIKSPPF